MHDEPPTPRAPLAGRVSTGPGDPPASSGWPLALLPIPYFSAAPDGRLLQANAHLAAMLGFASPEELARFCASGISAVWEDPEDWEALKVLLAARGEVARYPAALRRRDGSRLPCAVAARLAAHPGAGGLTLEAVVQGDAERHVAFAALTQVLRLYRDVLDLIPDPVFIHEKGRILVANPAAEGFFRVRGRGALVGRTFEELLHPESLARAGQRMRDLAQGGPQSEEYPLVLARGEARWVRAFNSPIVHQGRPAVLTLLHDRTERRQAEELHRAMVEHAPDATVIHDDGVILFANPAAAALFHAASPAAMTGWTLFDLFHPDSRPVLHERRRMVHSSPGPCEGEYAFRLLDGEPRHVFTSSVRVTYQGRQVLLSVFHDLTGRRLAEAALEETGLLYRTILDLSSSPILVHDRGTVLFANRAAEDFFTKRLEGLAPAAYLSPESAAWMGQRIQAVLDGANLSGEYELALPDGERRWVQDNSIAIPYRGREAMLTLLRDLTERHRAEELYRAILDLSPDPIAVHDREEVFFTNRAANRFFSLPPEGDRPRLTPADLLSPESTALVEQRMEAFLAGKTLTREFSLVLADGSRKWVEAFSAPIRRQDRPAMLTVLHDLTDRRHAEQDLAEAEALYRVIVEASPDPHIIHDDGRILFVNPAAGTFFGIEDLERMVGMGFDELFHPESRPLYHARRATVLAGQTVPAEYTFRTVGGALRHIHGRTQPIRFRGRPAMLSTIHDLTELDLARSRHKDLFESAPLGIGMSTPEGRYVQVNRRMAEIFGYPSAGDMVREVTDIGQQLYADPADNARLRRLADHQGVAQDFECLSRRRDGSLFWAARSVRTVRDAEGRLLGHEVFVRDISARRRAEAALEESRQRLADILGHAPLGFAVASPQGGLLQANLHYARMHGYASAGEMLAEVQDVGRQVFARPGDYQELRLRLEREEEVRDFERQGRRRDGSLFWTSRHARAVYDPAGLFLGYESFVLDIDARRRAEEALRVKEQAIASSINGMTLTDLQGRRFYVNRAALDMGGYADEAEVLGRHAREFWDSPEELDRVIAVVRASGSWQGELLARRRDGSAFPALMSGSLVLDEAGNPVALAASFVDITERKRAEERYQDILRLAPLGFERSTPDGRYLEVNPRLAEMHGYPTAKDMLAEVRDMGSQVFARPDDCQELRRRLERAEVVRDFECRGRRWDGSLFWTSRHARAAYDPDGGFLGYESFVLDIDARRRAEEELRVKEQAIDSSLNGVVLTSLEGRRFYVNRSLLDMWRYAEEAQVLGRRSEEFWADPREFAAAFAAVKATGSWQGELLALRADGSTFPALVTTSLVHDANGLPLAITASFVDITDLKQAEAKARERGRRVRALAAELALASERERSKMAQDLHDGPVQHLALVDMVIRSLVRHVPDPTHLEAPLALLAEAEGMLRATIADLSPPALFHETLAGALDRLALEFQDRHFLEVETSCPELPGLPVEARAFLFRAARELLVNALKHGRARRAAVRVEIPGNTLALLVEDDGRGFDPGRLDSPDLGSQGLPGLRSRARDLGGGLSVDSAPGTGARVRLVLPRDALGLAAEPSDGGEG